MALDQTMTQRMLPSAQLVAWAELLALPAESLDAYVADQVARNAALDVPVGRTCNRCGGTVWRAGAHACLSRHAPVDLATIAAASGADALLADLALSPADRYVAEHLLADVDERGRLDRPLADVAAECGVGEADVRRVLVLLRTVTSPGFGARDMREALLLQLDARDDVPPHVRAAIEALDLDADARGWIAANLTPGSAPEAGAVAAPVRPDLWVDETLTVRLVDAPWLALRVSPSYERLVGTDRSVCSGRAVVARLQTRADALVRVAQEAVDRQRAWVTNNGTRTTTTQASVANALGLHESTVSRAVAGKRLLLPDGRVVKVKELFGGRGGSARDVLRELIANETTPRSDADLARALTARGHPSARRTVAKYRAQLGIPARRTLVREGNA